MLKVAIAIVDELGVEALSMRSLAERLGVTAMALYRCIDSHEALLDAVHCEIINEQSLHVVTRESSFREVLTEMAKALRRAFKAHPRAAVLFASRPARGARSLVHLDATIGRLVSAGFEFSMAVYLIDAISAFTVGLCLSEFGRGKEVPLREPKLTQVGHDAPNLPNLERLAALQLRHDYETEFIIGLLALIDGFGSRYAKRPHVTKIGG
jgi:AcrR family transcriptional regulator